VNVGREQCGKIARACCNAARDSAERAITVWPTMERQSEKRVADHL